MQNMTTCKTCFCSPSPCLVVKGKQASIEHRTRNQETLIKLICVWIVTIQLEYELLCLHNPDMTLWVTLTLLICIKVGNKLDSQKNKILLCLFSPTRPLWAELVCKSPCPGPWCLSPSHAIFFQASHWPSGHMIRSQPLIGRPFPAKNIC